MTVKNFLSALFYTIKNKVQVKRLIYHRAYLKKKKMHLNKVNSNNIIIMTFIMAGPISYIIIIHNYNNRS